MTLRFKRSTLRMTILSLAMAFQVLAGRAYAQEVEALDLKLHKTYIKTQNTTLNVTADFFKAFTDTTVTCPENKCVIKVDVSSQVFNLKQEELTSVSMTVSVDNNKNIVNPNSNVGVDTNPAPAPRTKASARTFAWMVKDLDKGNHTVSVSFGTNSGASQAGFRTLTIAVYTP